MSLDDVTFKDEHSKGGYRAKDSRLAITDHKGTGRYVILSERDKRELALTWLAETHDLRFYLGPNGSRRIDAVLKQKPVRQPQVGEFYRVPGRPDMAAPWRDSPIAKVVKSCNPSYIHLETLGGERTGWEDIRALGEPLKVAVQTEWVVEES